MRIAVFSAKPYDRAFFEEANLAAGSPHAISFHETRLDPQSAIIARDAQAVCPFVNERR